MKKQILYLAGIAAIFASCSREAIEAPEETQGPHDILIQASVEETRTSLSIDGTTGTYSWQPMESIAVMEENGSEPCDFTVSDAANGYFRGQATNELIGAVSPFTALGMYAGEEFILSLSGEYDYADGTNAVMVAGAPTVVNGPEGDMQKFTFKHAAGLVMVTYENLPFGTKGVRFTTNKPIVGDWEFNSFDNVVLNGLTEGSTTAYVMFDEPIGNDELNQTFSFYIPVPVNDYTGLEIALVDNGKNDIAGTKKKMASKAFSVACGDVIKLPTVTLTPAEVQEAGYEKITSTDDLTDGQYLIVYEEGSVAFNGGLETLDAIGNKISVVIADSRIAITEANEAAEFTFASVNNAWTIKSKSGYYIGHVGSGNKITTSTETAYENSVDFEGGNVFITHNDYTIYYNSDSNQTRFRYFNSTSQKNVQLYKKVEGGPISGKTAVELSFNPAGPFEVNSSEAESFVAPDLVNPSNVPVTYSMVGGNDGVEIDAATGELTFVNGLDACNLTITASFAGSSVYEAATASYEISVVAPVNGIAALKALIPDDGEEYKFTMNLTNAVVTSVSTQNNTYTRVFMQDGNAGIVLFNTGADLAEKDVLNGVVTGKAKIHQGLNEIVEIDINSATKTTQATLPCDEYTIEEILTLGMDIESMRVKVSFAETSIGNNNRVYLNQGTSSIQYYDRLNVASLTDGQLVNVTGYYTNFKASATTAVIPEICVYKANDVETVAKPVITLSNVPTSALTPAEQDITVNYTVANPISGASVSASTEADWLDAEAEDGEILIMVGSNDGETAYTTERTGVVTVSYPYTDDQTITITQSGNSFAITYATVQGGTLSGPARAKANQEVTLVATPASDSYTFDNNWTVTPALSSVTAPTVANNKFTMPASDVTVEGSFTKEGATSYVTELTHELFESQYSTSETTFTKDNISFGYINAINNSSNGTPQGWAKDQVIQTKGSIYNKTSMGSINKVRFYIAVEGNNSFSVLYGDDASVSGGTIAKPSTPSGTETISYTKYENKQTSTATTTINYYDFDVDGAEYFKFSASKAVYIYKIEVYYEL